MPVYNCARFLRESIASVLGQTFRDFELIVVDDGSSDGSWAIIHTFPDKRIRSFRFEQNLGVGLARNFAIEKADSEYVAFLDSDDVAHPRRFAFQVACLASKPDIGAVASRAWIRTPSGDIKQPFESLTPEEISVTLVFRNCLTTSSISIRRRLWIPFPSDSEPGRDYYLWARLCPEVRFALFKRMLVVYRDQSGGISKRLAVRMPASIRRTHNFQLDRLHVEPKLDLHAMLSAWPPDASSEQLSEAEHWLRLLLSANRIYDPPSFQRVAERIWFRICLDSWTLGPHAFELYCRSPLATLTPIRMAHFFRRFGRRALAKRLAFTG
jgi:glycosyltransferase involved in cell wall biosynthesis